MAFPNKKLLSAMKDCRRLVLRANGVESPAITDGKGGKDGNLAII